MIKAFVIGSFCGVGALYMETILFVIRGTRIDQQMVMKDERLKRGQVNPFSLEVSQQPTIDT
jgi:hypothetical protein